MRIRKNSIYLLATVALLGLQAGSLYYHFASKADLIREVYRANGVVTEGWDPDADFVAPTSRAVVERIVEQARAEFARMQANEDFLRHMAREDTLGDDDARAVGQQMADAWRDALDPHLTAVLLDLWT